MYEIQRLSSFDRIPPQSLEGEQSVLGSMLIEREAIDIVAGILNPGDFYRDAHRVIFEAILALWNKDEPVDLLTTREQLASQNVLENIGGPTYLLQLTNAVPSAANAEYYAKIVLEKSILRNLIDAANQIQGLAHSEYDEIGDVVAQAGAAFQAATERQLGERLPTMRQMVSEAFDRYEAAGDRPKGQLSGLPTGVPDLDFVIDGFQPGDVVLICARPGIGKSAISINTFAFEALRRGKRVVVFSMEMSRGQLIDRLISRMANAASHKLRNGSLEDDDWRRVGEACSNASEFHMRIDDGFEQTPTKIRGRLREIERLDGKVDLVVVDYLLLMHPDTRREKEHLNVAATAAAIKRIAREFHVPVILLHQMNKGIDYRADGRPVMGDAKEAGDADADLLLFLWKEKDQSEIAEGFEHLWLSIAKNRNGKNGDDIPLMYRQATLHFAQMSDEERRKFEQRQEQPTKLLPRRTAEPVHAITSQPTATTRPSAYKDNDEDSTGYASSALDMAGWNP